MHVRSCLRLFFEGLHHQFLIHLNCRKKAKEIVWSCPQPHEEYIEVLPILIKKWPYFSFNSVRQAFTIFLLLELPQDFSTLLDDDGLYRFWKNSLKHWELFYDSLISERWTHFLHPSTATSFHTLRGVIVRMKHKTTAGLRVLFRLFYTLGRSRHTWSIPFFPSKSFPICSLC